MTELTLYQFEECPFCAKVRSKLNDLGLEYQKVNVPYDRSDPQRKELLDKSGVATVPVLKVVDNDSSEKYIGESEIIIQYLQDHFGRK